MIISQKKNRKNICSSNGGSTISAGLPNIKGQETLGWSGQHMGLCTNGSISLGAFQGEKLNLYNYSSHSVSNGDASTMGVNVPLGMSFDASKYNSIYSDDCTTVQPPAYRVYAWRRKE